MCGGGFLAKELVMAEKKRHPSSPDVDTGHATGPTSVEGLEASQLPEGEERGSVDTDPRRVVRRKLTSKTGGTIGGEVGERAMPGSADADDHGGRRRNWRVRRVRRSVRRRR